MVFLNLNCQSRDLAEYHSMTERGYLPGVRCLRGLSLASARHLPEGVLSTKPSVLPVALCTCAHRGSSLDLYIPIQPLSKFVSLSMVSYQGGALS